MGHWSQLAHSQRGLNNQRKWKKQTSNETWSLQPTKTTQSTAITHSNCCRTKRGREGGKSTDLRKSDHLKIGGNGKSRINFKVTWNHFL